MDTQALRIFLAVAETQSFTMAAQQVFLTQPAISKRIAQLEKDMDCLLFDRISRKAYLTQAGKILLPQAREILRSMEHAKQSLQTTSNLLSGTISIAISHHLGLHRVPEVLESFNKTFPNIRLEIDFTDSEIAYQGVLSGEYELAIITLAPKAVEHIVAVKVWHDELVFTCANNHPLASLTKPQLSDLSQYECLPPALSTYTGRILRDLFEQHGLNLNVRISTNFFETIAKMTEIGLGWSLIPKTLVTDKLTIIQIDSQCHRELGYIHHTKKTLSSSSQQLLKALKNAS